MIDPICAAGLLHSARIKGIKLMGVGFWKAADDGPKAATLRFGFAEYTFQLRC